MKVYRYPSSSPSDTVLVDEKPITENIKNDLISFDISLDKTAERKSGVKVKFDLVDYEALQVEMIKAFKKEIDRLQTECLKMKSTNLELLEVIPIAIKTIINAKKQNMISEDIDYISHLLSSLSRTNPDLIIKHLLDEKDAAKAMSKLEKISYYPWEM